MSNIEFLLFILFAFVIIIFLILDLGFLNKRSHKISTKSALIQTVFWIAISLIFALLIYIFKSHNEAFEFLSAYLTEKTLSVDNLFVILLIFTFFNLEEKYYHKVLFWGIIGAIFLRGIFISAGSFVVSQFHWTLYLFGALLVFSGLKLIFTKEENQHIDPQKSKVIKFAKKLLPFTTDHHAGKFFLKKDKRVLFTDLFIILLLVETTDLIFAVDSIPAAFAITQNNFVIYTSNIFAILGLRSMFFLLSSILDKFHYLKHALAFILVFIGSKMLIDIFHIKIAASLSFGIILGAFLIAIFASMMFPKKVKKH